MRTLSTVFTEAQDRGPRPGALAWAVLAILGIALFVVGVPTTAEVYDADLDAVFMIFTVLCGGLIVAPLFPRIVSGTHLVAMVGLAVVTYPSSVKTWPQPVVGLLAFAALLAILGLWGRWIVAIVVWWLGILLLLGIVVIEPGRESGIHDWGANILIGSLVSASVLGVGIALGQRRRIRAELDQARRDVELEQARSEHIEDRRRIAREMHDVVVHSMSLVHMQASSAPYRLSGLDEATRAEFANIAQSARAALGEMRQVLGVLRPDLGDAPRAPQPRLADLQELALVTTRAGCPVTLTVAPECEESSAVMQLTVYRIVQEALSNVLRHAPGAAADVVVGAAKGTLAVEVVNGPEPAHTARGGPAERGGRGGRGLLGMQERVAQLGGHIEHGPTADGGFRLAVQLPLENTQDEATGASWPFA